MREDSKWMDFSLSAAFSLEALVLFSPGLIWTHCLPMISPTREEDLNTSQVKLIFIHDLFSQPWSWSFSSATLKKSPSTGLWRTFYIYLITLLHSISQVTFPLKSPEWFQVVMNLRTVFRTIKNKFIQDRKYNPILMLYHAEDHHERQ